MPLRSCSADALHSEPPTQKCNIIELVAHAAPRRVDAQVVHNARAVRDACGAPSGALDTRWILSLSSPRKGLPSESWTEQKELAEMANTVRLSGKFQQFRADGTTPSYQYVSKEQSQYGSARLTFTVAATSGEGEDTKVRYIRCIASGTVAEALAPQAGKLVDFTGHIDIKKKDVAGGKPVYYTNIVVDSMNEEVPA